MAGADMEGEDAADRGPERLPRGRHRLSVSAVAEHQRSRLLGAAAKVFFENGYLGTTARRIAISAGVSSSAFYRQFEDVSDCLRAAFDVAAEALYRALIGPCQADADRVEAARAGAQALSLFALAEPQLTHLLGADLAAAEGEIAARRHRLFLRLASSLRGSGEETPRVDTASIGEQLIAAAVALNSGLGEGQSSDCPDLATEMDLLADLAGGWPW